MKTYSTRHEHCAVGMAMGYHSATGKVGGASVTCGPGFTQLMTILTTAVRSRVPIVVFAGEAPSKAKWYSQAIDQQPFAAACGAHYISGHNPERMHQYVQEAFHIAQQRRIPVVLGVPYDIQKLPMPDIGPYEPSASVLPQSGRIPPDPEQIAGLADKLAAAQVPVIIAGRGVLRANARAEVEDLADEVGAMLSTTLLGRGMYDHHPFSLGVAGGFARAVSRDVFAKADLVIAIGASMSYHTVDGGKLFNPSAEIVQIDVAPVGLRDGARVAHEYLCADARLSALALLDALRGRTAKAAIRSDDLARRIRVTPADPTEYPAEPGVLDPREVIQELEGVLPGDFDVISGNGHQSYFHTVMRGGDPNRYHVMRDFGAVGNALSYTLGIAAARGNGRVVLFEGDGGLMMHIQELETARRQGIKFLVVASNDGAYGSEIHKLRAEGIDDSGAVFGRPDLGAIARGFGLRGVTVTESGQFAELLKAYEAGDEAEIWDLHVSDKVVNPRVRRGTEMGHGVR
jgi:thiamine pyrophosphate-dependent acetolactate synthase large subunit-like protein